MIGCSVSFAEVLSVSFEELLQEESKPESVERKKQFLQKIKNLEKKLITDDYETTLREKYRGKDVSNKLSELKKRHDAITTENPKRGLPVYPGPSWKS